MISTLFSPQVVTVIGSLLAAAMTSFFHAWFKEKSGKAESNFLLGVQIAYLAVNEVAKRTPNEVDDKVALGLRILGEHLAKSNQALSAADAERAKALFSAMHGDGVA